MVDLILVGASGLAREVLSVLHGAGDDRSVGVLDDSPGLAGTTLDGAPVLGSVDTIGEYPQADILLCVGSGRSRARLAARLEALGVDEARYTRVVHASVDVPASCSIAPGCIVLAGVVLTTDVVLGPHVAVMPHVTLTHGDRVGAFVTLCAGVTLGGDVRIEQAAYLGMNSAVRQLLTVGADSTIGMGAVVLCDIPPGQTWLGVPARRYENGQPE